MQSAVPNLCRLHRRAEFITRFVQLYKPQMSRISRSYHWNEKLGTPGPVRWQSRKMRSISYSASGIFTGTFSPFRRSLSTSPTSTAEEKITINYIGRDGEKMSVKGVVGDSLLDVALDNDLDIEGYGACEGTLACSTCHLYFEESRFDALPEASDEEQDMLDFACGLTETSRLGCQITVTKDMDGMTVTVPEGVADARGV